MGKKICFEIKGDKLTFSNKNGASLTLPLVKVKKDDLQNRKDTPKKVLDQKQD